MTARGPYTASLDGWVAQLVGGSTGYGNGDKGLLHVGPAPNAVPGDPDFKSRSMIEFSATDVAAMLADATVVDDCTLTVTVGPNTCIGSRGSTIRILCEEMTVSFTEKAVSSTCSLSSVSSSGTSGWHRSNSATTTNRAFHSSGSHSTGDDLTFDLTDWAAARLAAEDYSAVRFRLIAANDAGTGYAEETSSRRIALYAREDGTAGNRPRLSANVTLGDVPKSVSDTGSGADAFSVDQSGDAPVLPETGVGVDAFVGGPAAGWTTGFDDDDNGRAILYLPIAGSIGQAVLPVTEGDIQLRCKVQLDKVPQVGSAAFMLLLRGTNPNNCYRARITMGGPLHDIGISIAKVVAGTATTLQFISNIRAFLADTDYWLKFQVSGASPTTLNAKVWRDGDSEPGWVLNVQDSEAALQADGIVGMGGSLTTTVLNPPITMIIDQFEGYAP